jgi:hypothetical protein
MYEVRADLKDTGKTRGNGHLFVDLWGLCERGVGAKEVDVEHGRAALRRCALQLGCVHLYEPSLSEAGAEHRSDPRPEPHHQLRTQAP